MSASGLPPLLFLLAVVAVVVTYQAIRRPVQRRLAVRDVIRRRNETALVIAGSLLGTALITGSFIVGDTLDASIRASATTQLGPIDETITVTERDRADSLVASIRALDAGDIDGVTSFQIAGAAFSSEASGRLRAEPQGQLIELDFEEAMAFGGDPEATGLTGGDPPVGRVAITRDLADSLEIGEGDELTFYAYGSQVDLEVDRLLPRRGVAGFDTSFRSVSTNAFVPPGTIASLVTEDLPEGASPPRFVVAVSNTGGVEDGADLTGAVTGLIEREVLDPTGGGDLRVDPVKQDTLDVADEQGDQFSQLFISIGSFAIIAGILLLVNIFVMLSEERKNQLGMLRAVGMRRSDLVRLFFIEGAIYAASAGILGALLGIGVGFAIARLAAPIFSSGGDFSLDLLFSMSPYSIVGGFCIGTLISIATVVLTSIRISRINIIRAIRDLPEPKLERVRLRSLILGGLLAALGAAWFAGSLGNDAAWAGAILGPVFVVWGLVPLARRVVGPRYPFIAASALSLLWGVFGNAILSGQFFDGGDLFAFVIQGVILTFSAVVLLSQTQEMLEGLFRRVAATRLALRLGLAYPLARRFRTGLTLGMFALVMFTMVFIASLSSIFSGQVATTTRKGSGGFDIYARSSTGNPPAPSDLAAVEGVDEVASASITQALFTTSATSEPAVWPLSGIDEDFVTSGPPVLDERLEGLEDDAAAWERVIQDRSAIIVDSFFLQGGGGPPAAVVEPGDEVGVQDPITGKKRDVTVVGVFEVDVAFAGSYMSKEAVADIAGPVAAVSRFYVATSGVPSAEVGKDLEAAFLANGVEAKTFRRLVEEQNALSVQFLNLMQGYLALGLLVGIAGLGVVMIRAVRERRREIGVLRSLGLLPGQVRAAFLFESGFVALEGITIGTVLALVTAAQLVANGDFGEGLVFTIPWVQLSVLCGIAALASLAATAWPALKASRTPPAVALRIAD